MLDTPAPGTWRRAVDRVATRDAPLASILSAASGLLADDTPGDMGWRIHVARNRVAQRSDPSRTAVAAPVTAASPDGSVSSVVAAARDAFATDWAAWLTLLAGMAWLLAHLPAFVAFAVPAWIVSGLAVGLVRPWYGLLLTVAVVPFSGGAVEAQTGEILRVVPIYGAAVRVLADRFIIAPSFGRVVEHEPPWWVVAAAIAAAGLYVLSALTGYIDAGRDPKFLEAGLLWTAGGAAAGMAAWVAGSHLVAGRDQALNLVVLLVTIIACVAALAVWAGMPGIDLFTFPARVEGDRLGALGYPTPTAMGLATVLPLAVMAAWQMRRWLVVPVIGLIVVTMVLTHSRGPLIAVGVGAVVAALAYRRVDRRLAIAGVVIGAGALVGLVVARYGTNLDSIVATINGSMGSDVDRINTWVAAFTIAAASPLVGGGWYALIRVGDFADRRIANSHNVLLDALASGGIPLAIANGTVILYSGWQAWARRHTMAVWLIAAVVTWLVCGFWDIPLVRSYAAVMGGIVLGMAAGPLIGRAAEAVEVTA